VGAYTKIVPMLLDRSHLLQMWCQQHVNNYIYN